MARKFGIEIEAKGMTLIEVSALLNENGIGCTHNDTRILNDRHQVIATWKVVLDGSVSGGFELVSPPLSDVEGLAEVKKVVELLNDAGCDVDKSCGVHVHVDCNNLSGQHVANIYNRYLENEATFDSFMPISRRENNNHYCLSLNREGRLTAQDTAQATAAQRCDRYRKINLCSFVKYGTIEFRQHAGSLNSAKITNWIKLLVAFVEASAPTNMVVSEETYTVYQDVPRIVAAASSDWNRNLFSGKQRQLHHTLMASPNGATAEELAVILTSTVASVQSMICRMRRDLPISKRRGRYLLTAAAAMVPTTVIDRVPVQRTRQVTSCQLASLWTGVPQQVQSYFTRRARMLSTLSNAA